MHELCQVQAKLRMYPRVCTDPRQLGSFPWEAPDLTQPGAKPGSCPTNPKKTRNHGKMWVVCCPSKKLADIFS